MLLKSEFSDYYNEVKEEYKINNPRQLLTVIRDGGIPECYCGNLLKWKDTKYTEHCSLKCSKCSPKVREKTRNTCIEKYGVSNPFQAAEAKEKITQTNLKKYGYEHPGQIPEIKQKARETYIRNNTPERKAQVGSRRRNTSREKYGTDHHRQRNYSQQTLEFLSNRELFTKLVSEKSMEELSKIYDISPYPIYSRMKELGLTPIRNQTSLFEKEILEYIKTIYDGTIIENDRTIIHPKELDIYLPELQLAIECNGTYWHSVESGKDELYHYDKTNSCDDKNIDLVYIWDYQWEKDQSTIKYTLKELVDQTYLTEKDYDNQITVARSSNIWLERNLRHNGYLRESVSVPEPENIKGYTLYNSGIVTYIKKR